MKKWLFHPFTYVAGLQVLVIGWLIMVAMAVICYYSNVHFDGVLDMHVVDQHFPFGLYVLEQVVDWGCLVLVFFPVGLIFSRSSIRLIDIAGTMALARWPLIFTAVIGFGIHIPVGKHPSLDELESMMTPANIGFGLLSFVFIIWMVALLWQAFSISMNLKGGKAVTIFIVGLVLAEVISKLILPHVAII